MATNLPTDIAGSYPDRSQGDRAHQQHHDTVHGAVNELSATVESGRLSDGALKAAIADATAGLEYRTDAAGDTIQSALDTKQGILKLAVLGDSTGNDSFDWPYLVTEAIAGLYGDLHIERTTWNHDTLSYPSLTTVQEGTGYTPPSSSTTLVADNFDRTAPDLVGTTPQTGGAWYGTAGRFSLDGTRLVINSPGYAAANGTESPTGMTTTATGVEFDTTPSTTTRTLEVGTKVINASNQVFVSVSCLTDGSVKWEIWQKIGDVGTQLADGGELGLTPSAVNTFDMSITVDGADVTAVVNGVTATATLDPATVTALADGNGVVIWPKNAASAGIKIGGITGTTGATPASGHALILYNGSRSGSTLDYHQTHMAAILPTDTDVVIVSSSHNYGLDDAATYLAALDAAVADALTQAPNARVIVSSQNPQIVGPRTQSQVDAHVGRLRALRIKARDEGWGYIPVLEGFLSRPDGGQSLVLPDGVHPTSSYDDPADNGCFLWRDVFMAYLKAHRLVAV